MRQIVTDFQPFENHKKLLKNMADRHLESRFLPTKIREEPERNSAFGRAHSL